MCNYSCEGMVKMFLGFKKLQMRTLHVNNASQSACRSLVADLHVLGVIGQRAERTRLA